MYIYEAGSPFEAVLNDYMITGKGIYPLDPRGFGSEGKLLNVTMAGATLNGSIVASGMGMGSVQANAPPSALSASMAS